MSLDRRMKFRPMALIMAALLATSAAIEAKPSPAAKPAIAKTPSTRQAARAIRRIDARNLACRHREPFMGPAEVQQCDSEAIDAYHKLVSRSRANALFKTFHPDMFGVFMYRLTPSELDFGHDALSKRVLVMWEYTRLARQRAEILTGVARPTAGRPLGRSISGMFDWIDRTPGMADWVDDKTLTSRGVTRRWTAIRNADCAAYPVPRCRERLDEAMRRMVTTLKPSWRERQPL